MKKAIKLSPTDNVATVLSDVVQGELVGITDKENNVLDDITSLENIGRGHKIAVENINSGDRVIKYGYVIGIASKSIAKGEFVHVHNLESSRGRGDLA